MTKVIALWRQGWWPDQGCRLLGMGLVLILSNDIQPRDAILAPIKTTKIATPMAGSITRPSLCALMCSHKRPPVI
jgi:hypothetical protein